VSVQEISWLRGLALKFWSVQVVHKKVTGKEIAY